MTKDEARNKLESSEEIASWTDDNGITCHYQVGDFYKEYDEGYSFIVYPYSSKKPVDPTYAFAFIVFKDTGDIDSSTSPIPTDELKEEKLKKLEQVYEG